MVWATLRELIATGRVVVATPEQSPMLTTTIHFTGDVIVRVVEGPVTSGLEVTHRADVGSRMRDLGAAVLILDKLRHFVLALGWVGLVAAILRNATNGRDWREALLLMSYPIARASLALARWAFARWGTWVLQRSVSGAR